MGYSAREVCWWIREEADDETPLFISGGKGVDRPSINVYSDVPLNVLEELDDISEVRHVFQRCQEWELECRSIRPLDTRPGAWQLLRTSEGTWLKHACSEIRRQDESAK